MLKTGRVAITIGFLATTIAITLAARPLGDRTSDAEMVRLQTHFVTVLAELRSADVSKLSAPQSAARSEMIRRLEAYAAEGRFPHNHVLAGKFTPVFRDQHGTLCAMGFLIASTGRHDIVNDVVRTANLARIPELASDPRLVAWLDSTGLSVAEAARIQPSYDGGRCCPLPAPQEPIQTTHTEPRARPAYYVGSAFASALSGATATLNLLASNNPSFARRATAIGFVAGATQVVLGAFVLDQPATPRAVGVANMIIGSASIGTSIWRTRRVDAPQAVATRTVSVAPLLSRGGAGLMLAAKL